MPSRVIVESEIGRLRSVLVHRPDIEIEVVPSERTADWLFEDPLWLERAQQEYDQLLAVLRAVAGRENVFEFMDLVEEVLETQEVRWQLIGAVNQVEHLDSSLRNKIATLNSRDLARLLIRGSLPSEPYHNLFPSTPNLVFTRDLGAVVGSSIIVGHAKKPARQRESLLMNIVARHHPLFASTNPIFLEIPSDKRFWLSINQLFTENPDPDALILSIEGGDLMVFDEDTILVGCGERTTSLAVDMLTTILFERQIVSNVFKVMLPPRRSSMHLDTICTIADFNEFIIDESYVSSRSARSLPVVHMQRRADGKHRQERFDCLESALRAISPKPKFIRCGGDVRIFQSREQWSDAANVLALAPGVVLAYDRNERTLGEMEGCGYAVMSAIDFAGRWGSEAESLLTSKTVVTIEGQELSRARGGPHCMTMPLQRERPLGRGGGQGRVEAQG